MFACRSAALSPMPTLKLELWFPADNRKDRTVLPERPQRVARGEHLYAIMIRNRRVQSYLVEPRLVQIGIHLRKPKTQKCRQFGRFLGVLLSFQSFGTWVRFRLQID